MIIRKAVYFVSFFSVVFLFSCETGKYALSNKGYKKKTRVLAKQIREYPVKDSSGLPYNDRWVGTTNMSLRKPNFVIIHHTAQNSCEQTLRTFTTEKAQVSSHYVLCKDGTVYHMLNDLLRSHHAGVGKWGNTTDLNSSSIGIEMDNNGFEPFTQQQINSLLILLERLKRAYTIPAANFIGHADIAPGRKVDPNRYFPWELLAGKGYGLWYDTTGITVPDNFDPLQHLRLIGYDIRRPEAAIQSFKIHFVPTDTTLAITDTHKKILIDLSRRYQ